MVYKIEYNNIIVSLLLLIGAGYIYNKLKLNIETGDKRDDLDIIKKYFLDEQDDNYIRKLSSIKKPIIWIHIDYEKNSRKWDSFMSRNTYKFNQDYLFLTINSIIKHCAQDFHICLIDDNSFKKLIDGWNIDLNKLAGENREQIRKLAIFKLLYLYGGVYIENSFIMFKNIKSIYDDSVESHKPIFGEQISHSTTSHVLDFVPSSNFIICTKNNKEINEIIKFLEINISTDNTSESCILEVLNKFLLKKLLNNNISCIDGRFLGIKDDKNNIITIDSLMSSNFLKLDDNIYCVFIPRKELEKRVNYNWFTYLNMREVLTANTNISKYLLLSNDTM